MHTKVVQKSIVESIDGDRRSSKIRQSDPLSSVNFNSKVHTDAIEELLSPQLIAKVVVCISCVLNKAIAFLITCFDSRTGMVSLLTVT